MRQYRLGACALLAMLLTLAACGRGANTPTPLPQSAATVKATSTPRRVATVLPPTTTPVRPTPTEATEPLEQPSLPDAQTAELEAFLSNLIYQQGGPSRRAPGAVLLVDTPAGRFLQAAGVSNLATNEALSVDDRFEIGSITKVFTAVLLLQLHEEGLLSLDDTLSIWLPELADQLPYGDEITLRQLASHTAGLNDYERALYPMPDILVDNAALERGYTPDQLVTWIAENNRPLFAPGEPGQWRYSSAGYALLGLVLEAATGESLGDLYQSRIFDPLGLESALLLTGVPEDGQIVSGYNAMQGEYVDVTRWNASGAWAAGALAMNAPDLAAFAAALVDGRLFSESDALDAMIDFVPTGQDRGFTGYGLGLAELAGGALGHAGGTPGFAAMVVMQPKEGAVGVFLSNSGAANMAPESLGAMLGY